MQICQHAMNRFPKLHPDAAEEDAPEPDDTVLSPRELLTPRDEAPGAAPVEADTNTMMFSWEEMERAREENAELRAHTQMLEQSIMEQHELLESKEAEEAAREAPVAEPLGNSVDWMKIKDLEMKLEEKTDGPLPPSPDGCPVATQPHPCSSPCFWRPQCLICE